MALTWEHLAEYRKRQLEKGGGGVDKGLVVEFVPDGEHNSQQKH